MSNMVSQLQNEKLLPLYTVNNMDLLDTVESILLENNLHFIEVTYRSDKASAAIKYLSESGKLIVGAGTVCDLETAKNAIANGAQFIVQPGIDADVLRYCKEKNIPIFPGAVTPTEIIQAMNLGLTAVKFFPANVYGGLKAIKSLGGPFPSLKFIPTGGINKENYQEFIENDSILAVGGSFIISEKTVAIDNGVTASKNLKELVSKINK